MKKIITFLVLIISINSIGYVRYADAVGVDRVIEWSWWAHDEFWDPIIWQHDFRFSLWFTSEAMEGDKLPDWDLDYTSPNYWEYTEHQTITSSWWVFYARIGDINPLPILDSAVHRFLQVEILWTANDPTEYRVIDFYWTLGPQYERAPVDPWLFEAWNFTSLWHFIIDVNEISWDVELIFWNVIKKILKWSASLLRFELNWPLIVWWDLTNTWSTFLWDDSNDNLTVYWSASINWNLYINWQNVWSWMTKLDTIEQSAKDDQNADEVPFTWTWLTWTNVQDVILELKARIEALEAQ